MLLYIYFPSGNAVASSTSNWKKSDVPVRKQQSSLETGEKSPAGAGKIIASARRRLGLTQSDLARSAQISRQALFQIESGATLPRIDTALRITQSLGMEISDLLSPGQEPGIFVQSGRLAGNRRVDVACLDGCWIAHPSDDPARIGAGFSPSDGLLVEEARGMKLDTRIAKESLAENVFLAGCDPALEMLAQEATRTGRRGRCVWIPCGNEAALGHLVRGEAHVAGVHFGGKSDTANLAAVRNLGLDKSCMMLRFSSWEQGWMIAHSAGKSFHGIESLVGTKLRLANREAGSGCRIELDRMAKRAGIAQDRIKGYQTVTTNHAECARRIASGFADVGLGCAAMAEAFALAFSPTVQVAFDLVIRRDQIEKPLVHTICNLVQSGKFLRELACIPGYETSASGHVVLA